MVCDPERTGSDCAVRNCGCREKAHEQMPDDPRSTTADKRAAPSAQGRTEVRLAFRQTAQSISRLSLGVFLSGLSGTSESPPLVLMVFRLLGAVAQSFRALPKRRAICCYVYMTMNRTLLPSTPSARRGLILNLLGFLVLLVGFGSAVFIWQAQDRIDRQARNAGTTDIAAAPLAPEDSRRDTHDLELYYGETGLLMDKWRRWFEGLAHGKSLAKTIAVLSLVGASGCFFSARVAKAGQ